MCNYNYCNYIGEAIESVLSQTYQNIELIIVDDGSTDNSTDIISSCDDPRLIKIFQENQGQAAAINKGFQYSKGEIIAFIDSDDFWAENKIEVVIDKFQKFDVCAVQHSHYIVDSDSINSNKIHPNLRPGLYNMLDIFIKNNDVCYFSTTSGISARKEYLDKIFPIDSEWKICADVAFSYPLAFFGDVYTTKEILGYYRIHDLNNWMNSNKQKNVIENKLRYVAYINGWFEKLGYNQSIDFKKSKYYRDWMVSQKSLYHPQKLFLTAKKKLYNIIMKFQEHL